MLNNFERAIAKMFILVTPLRVAAGPMVGACGDDLYEFISTKKLLAESENQRYISAKLEKSSEVSRVTGLLNCSSCEK